jgi:hypothetical protein
VKRRGSKEKQLGRLGGGRREDGPAFALGSPEGQWKLEDGGELVVGRAPDCDVTIDAPAVSRRHARVWMTGRDILVEDLGSRHGVFVNAVRITAPALVKLGDRIVLGDTVFSIVRAGQRNPDSIPSASGTNPVRITEPVPVTDIGLDALAVFGSVAGRALAAGRTKQATTVGHHLFESMMAAGIGNAQAVAQVEDTNDLFSWLSLETKASEWVDRIFEMRLAFRSRMTEVKLRAVTKIARDLPVPPNESRHAYIAWMRSQELTPAERQALDELAVAGS